MMIVKKGATSVITFFKVPAGSNPTNIDLSFIRSGSTSSSKVDATAGTIGTYIENTFVYTDSTNAPERAQVCFPNTAFGSGTDEVILTVYDPVEGWERELRVQLIDNTVKDVYDKLAPVAIDGGDATIGGMLTKLADNNDGADYSAAANSQKAIAESIVALAPDTTLANADNVTTGVEDSGDYNDTHTINSTYWQLSPTGAAVLDCDLTFPVGTGRKPNNVRIVARYEAGPPTSGKYVDVYAYNYNTSSYDLISSVGNRFENSISDEDRSFLLNENHIESGTGNNRIRFLSSNVDAASNLYIDYVGVDSVSQSGLTAEAIADAVRTETINRDYAGFIWIDTINGAAGDVVGVNGLPGNKVSNWADALSLASKLDITSFNISNGSQLTSTGGIQGYILNGISYVFNLAGYAGDRASFLGASVDGILTSVSPAPIIFNLCRFNDVTLPPFVAQQTSVGTRITMGTASGTYTLDFCSSGVAGGGSPEYVFAANCNLNLRHYSGGALIKNMTAGCKMSIEGHGQLNIADVSNTGGEIEVRGNFRITGEAAFKTAGGTINIVANFDHGQIIDDIETDVTNIDSNVTTVAGKVDIIDNNVDTIVGKLPVGNIASEADVQSIQNNTRFVSSIPANVVIPESGSLVYKVAAYFYDTSGNMEDPDNNEFALQVRRIQGASYLGTAELFDDYNLTTPATASTTFTPSYFKMVREGVGRYAIYVKLASTENPDQWLADFACEENSVELHYTRTTALFDENPGSVTLAENNTNKDIVAKAMKERDVSATSAVSGSIYKDVNDNIDANETKIDSVQTDVTGVKAKTDNLPIDPASETNATTNTSSINTNVDANETKIDALQSDVTEIKNKTSNLPSDPASETNATANTLSINNNIDANETKIDNLQSTVDGLNNISSQGVRDAMKLAPTVGAPADGSVDKHLDDVQERTDNLPNDPASETNATANTSDIKGNDDTNTASIIANDNSNTTGINNNINANEVKIDAVKTDTAAIKTQTDKFTFTGSNVNAQVKATDDIGLSDTQKSDVLAEARKPYHSDTIPELTGIADAPKNPTPAQAQMLTYMERRNGQFSNATEHHIFNDAEQPILEQDIAESETVATGSKLRNPD